MGLPNRPLLSVVKSPVAQVAAASASSVGTGGCFTVSSTRRCRRLLYYRWHNISNFPKLHEFHDGLHDGQRRGLQVRDNVKRPEICRECPFAVLGKLLGVLRAAAVGYLRSGV